MNPLASCKVAIAALKLNALRSFLAMLGVIIGVASVIVMVSVASGAGRRRLSTGRTSRRRAGRVRRSLQSRR